MRSEIDLVVMQTQTEYEECSKLPSMLHQSISGEELKFKDLDPLFHLPILVSKTFKNREMVSYHEHLLRAPSQK